MKSNPRRAARAVPQFRTVEKESAYWDRHSPLDHGIWEAVPYEEVCRDLSARGGGKHSVTLRLDKELILRLQTAARRHGIRYQALAREILWRSLLRKAQ